jgi:hypothetical protein
MSKPAIQSVTYQAPCVDLTLVSLKNNKGIPYANEPKGDVGTVNSTASVVNAPTPGEILSQLIGGCRTKGNQVSPDLTRLAFTLNYANGVSVK